MAAFLQDAERQEQIKKSSKRTEGIGLQRERRLPLIDQLTQGQPQRKAAKRQKNLFPIVQHPPVFGQPPAKKKRNEPVKKPLIPLFGKKQVPVKKRKNMTFPEARFHYNLPSFGDRDNDGVFNALDCHPFDPLRQDFDSDKQRRWFFANIHKTGLSKEDWDNLSKKKKKETLAKFREKQRKNPFKYIRNIDEKNITLNEITSMLHNPSEQLDLFLKDIAKLDKKHVTKTKAAKELMLQINKKILSNKKRGRWTPKNPISSKAINEYLETEKGRRAFLFGVTPDEKKKRKKWLNKEDSKKPKSIAERQYTNRVTTMLDEDYVPFGKNDPVLKELIKKHPKWRPKIDIDSGASHPETGKYVEFPRWERDIDIGSMTEKEFRKIYDTLYEKSQKDFIGKHYSNILYDYALETNDEFVGEDAELIFEPTIQAKVKDSEWLPTLSNFVSAPLRKKPLYPSTDEVEKMYKKEAKKNTRLYRDILAEVKQRDPERYKKLKKQTV